MRRGQAKARSKTTGLPNEGHRRLGVNPWRVEEGKPQFCGFVEVGDGGSELVLLQPSQRVCSRVVAVEMAQSEPRAGQACEDKVTGHRSSVVRPAFSAVGVDDGKSGHGGVEETIRGEKVKSHDVAPVEKTWK